MAWEINFPADHLEELLNTDFDEIAEEALKEAAPVLVASLKASCQKVIDHDGESELVESITSNAPKKARTGAWIVNVYPKGYSNIKKYRAVSNRNRKYAVSNALKLIWKEYGVAGRQAARPFLTNACNNARDPILAKLQEVYNRKVGAG